MKLNLTSKLFFISLALIFTLFGCKSYANEQIKETPTAETVAKPAEVIEAKPKDETASSTKPAENKTQVKNGVAKVEDSLGKAEEENKKRYDLEKKIDINRQTIKKIELNKENFADNNAEIDSSSEEMSANEMLAQAQRAKALGQYEAAKVLYVKVLEEEKNSIEAMYNLAQILQKMHQNKEASKLYAKILELDPSNEQALTNFLVLLGSTNQEKALEEFKKLEKISPGNPVIPANIAMVYLKNKNYKMAVKFFNRAILLDPENALYVYNLGVTADKIPDKQLAIRMYSKAIMLSRDSEQNLPESFENIQSRISYLAGR